VGSIGWSSSNGGLAAADSSIEEDRDRNMVVTTTIRAATAIIIRIMAAPLFGRDCVWRVTAFVELIGWSLVADMRTQIEGAALRRYFSLGKTVAIVAERPLASRRASSFIRKPVARNRDRGKSRDFAPPTPPDVRVRIRRFAG